MQTALTNAVDRLDAILVTETEALRSHQAIDLSEISGRKNQSLLELTRLTRGMSLDSLDRELMAKLAGLKERLHENQKALETQLHASRDIAAILSQSIKEAESDGTYGERPELKGRTR
ncbi:MAG: flagellar protein FlgN [Fulvimarina manganoxydans]|uniref:flagellar protein FlgN n=1 Tax=Fulvimarina manganoxydans TaxID=937218 RepID=UPI002351FB51|nr:flagellar protein FlgN [Fulvimarina manganoxydans]MCK5931922.1 flagellar protein FlgN [Fulvimarina manganoxydans]